MAYGDTDKTTIYVEDSGLGEIDYSDYLLYFTITKRINTLWYAELVFVDIGSTQKGYIKQGNTCKIFSNTTLLLKGIIQSVEYDSYNNAMVYVEGTVAKMKESITNETHTNTATNTIVSGLAAGTGITLGSNTNYGLVTVSYDNENNLRGVHDLADTVDYFWWEDWGVGSPYDTDYINFHSSYGSVGSTYTFNASGATQNIEGSEKELSVDKQANYIISLGYGDGVNQLKSEIYDATTIRSTLGSGFGAGSDVMYVIDTSDFGASGSVWVGCENMGYSAKGTGSLTGISSGLAFLGSPNVHQTYGHDPGVAVYEGSQWTPSSPQTDSSISDYGIIQKRFTDKRIIDQNALDIYGMKILADKEEPVEMITLSTTEYRDVMDNVSLGDNVDITDAKSDLSGNYKVVGMIFGFSNERGEYLDMELSSKKESFVDQVAKLEQATERVNVYMQGATNIYAISEAENCGIDNNLHMRFYLPTEAVSINSVKMNFKMKDYRYYTESTPEDAGSLITSSAVKDVAGGGGLDIEGIVSDVEGVGAWVSGASYARQIVSTINMGSAITDYGIGQFNVAAVAEDSSVGMYARIVIDGEDNQDVPDESDAYGYNIGDGDRTLIFPIGVNLSGAEVSLRTSLVGASTASVFIGGDFHVLGYNKHYHQVTTPAHLHAMSPAITSVSLTGGSAALWTGEDDAGSTLKGWYDADQTDLDITSEVRGIGKGKWVDLQFEPNKNMRIEGNAYVQMFIKSV